MKISILFQIDTCGCINNANATKKLLIEKKIDTMLDDFIQ